ncbi:lipase maturation factor family protein [Oscillatoria amoena NRMC-F 0135]|uniref:Lipase maturation factor family protein n=1 Tax=Geitlerinema calcuttense NRMC-F 0142 TaxID=2922238 RepID=A0ABT7M456_9CYAN|nr:MULTISPECIES: lipase maturation factor family protein [Cyanophyceae]MDL5050593.1 lipase maturation factor family protein [Oscillatoria amoena NRMC-F 0135]MDL5055607.1 lipase maturation factor family protein [Oscillatoria laete-virens NRMC-F 0139]MDL5057826.1 lipase maturation factor family protein [Geitlerinema calcuttense NRMC-F 0142]
MPENESNCHSDTPKTGEQLTGKNLLIIDGDCGFCRRWAMYFRQIARDGFEIVTSQEAGESFPQIASKQFAQSVAYIDKDGQISFAAEACFRALSLNPLLAFLPKLYVALRPFAVLTEWVYGFVASNRYFFSKVTALLWGKKIEIPRYQLLQFLFLRGLGLIYLVAFLSLVTQMTGLFGSQGVMPIQGYMQMVGQILGQRGDSLLAVWYVPSVFWLGQSDFFLMAVVWAGVIASLFLIVNIAPALAAAACFVLYLSICAVGEPFMSFQWDALLLEVGFLAIFFAPWKWWPWAGSPAASRVMVWLCRWLLFRFMFSSGVVKLSSQDPTWADWTALNYHYYTQPIPNPLSWFAHQLPEWFDKMSVGGMFLIQLIVPFFIFAPRRLRFVAGLLLAFLQITIILTGNYTFFNALTLLLILMCWDDQALEGGMRRISRRNQEWNPPVAVISENFFKRRVIVPLVAVLVVWMSVTPFMGAFRRPAPEWVSFWNRHLGQFRLVNGYGLFAGMTTQRREIVIEGSDNGVDWLAYEFKYKPGDVTRLPAQIAPFQPRLDWQMWFAALGNYQGNPWLLNLQGRILQGSEPVRKLLGTDPFDGRPPRYIRAVVYDYRFTSIDEWRETGHWWSRKLLGLYNPVLERRD